MQELFFIVSHCRCTLRSKPRPANNAERERQTEEGEGRGWGWVLGGGASGGRSQELGERGGVGGAEGQI